MNDEFIWIGINVKVHFIIMLLEALKLIRKRSFLTSLPLSQQQIYIIEPL